MPVTRERKEEQVQELRGLFESSEAVIVMEYRGLSAMKMADLRNRLRPLNTRVVVAKNTLALRTLTELGMPQPEEILTGTSLFGFCRGEIAQSVSTFTAFARENEFLKFKGAMVGHSVLGPQQAVALRELPPTSVVRAQLVGALQAPASGLVNLLDGALQSILHVLRARTEQLEEAAA